MAFSKIWNILTWSEGRGGAEPGTWCPPRGSATGRHRDSCWCTSGSPTASPQPKHTSPADTYLVVLGRCLPMIQLESLRKSHVPVMVLATGCHSWPSPIRRFPLYLLGGFYRQFWSSVHFLHFFLSHLGPSSRHPQLYLRRNACVDLSGLFENAGSGGQPRRKANGKR